MVLNKNTFQKKALAFTFLALFVSFLLFAIAGLYLYKGDLVENTKYKDSRITFVDLELKYFKDVYLQNALEYSLFNSMNAIENYAKNNETFLKKINNNYTYFNSKVLECILNGTIDGNKISSMDNRTLNFFLDFYYPNFEKNYRANLNFKIYNINIYESVPYYVNMQVFSHFYLKTDDNLSMWNFSDNFVVSVPIYNLKDPQFDYLINYSIPIRPVEYYRSNVAWDLYSFNNTLNNSYAVLYTQEDFKYLLGQSYIERLLNDSFSEYYGVKGLWSFDYDEDEKGVYDSSQNYNKGKLFGTTYLFMNFDDMNATDLSSYNNSGILEGDVDCNKTGISYLGCLFNGSNGQIVISNKKFNLNDTNNVSISLWINPRAYNDSVSKKGSEFFRYGSNQEDVVDLRFIKGKITMEIGNQSDGEFYQFSSDENISLNKWYYIVGTFNGNTGVGKIYINGKLANLNPDLTYQKSKPIKHFISSSNNISIGNLYNGDEHFNGTIDEVNIYKKVLSDDEVAYLYGLRKGKFIEYVDTLHEKGIDFNSKSYINISGNILNISQFSEGVWFKIYNFSRDNNDIMILVKDPYIIINSSSKKVCVYDTGVNDINGDSFYCSNSTLNLNEWYYVVSEYNNNTKEYNIYINGKLDARFSGKTGSPKINITLIGDNFEGVIDEIRLLNKSLDESEILRNYYNYDSFVKGRNNYFILINPNKMGFNVSPNYDKNISYSDKLFFDYYFRKVPEWNLTLFNITNITSNVTNKEYYNFLLDICMKNAFNIDSYNTSENPSVIVKFGQYNGSCYNLVKYGIY